MKKKNKELKLISIAVSLILMKESGGGGERKEEKGREDDNIIWLS